MKKILPLYKIAVDAFIVNKKIQILLAKRGAVVGNKQWSFVGGRAKSGETCLDTIDREIIEELGSKINVEITNQIVGIRDNCLPPDNIRHLTVVLLIKYKGGQISIQEPKECLDIKWFSLDKLPSNLFSGVEKIIKGYINNQSLFVLDYPNKKNNLYAKN